MKPFSVKGMCFSILFLASVLTAQTAYADKSSVLISAPEKAVRGSEVIIKLTITHSGNNLFHYTNWVYLSMNGKEFSRWTFTSDKRPEEAVFHREVKIPVGDSLELVAEANCNLHGSKGPAKKAIPITN